MGNGGRNATATGQATAVVHAPPDQAAQLTLLTLWLAPGDVLRITVDGATQHTDLRGHELPPNALTYRSKPGGTITVLSVTDVQDGRASFFSLAIGLECRTAADCSGHGVCTTDRICHCESGWGGASCGIKDLTPSPYFPGSRLITVDWGKQLNEWRSLEVPGTADQRWVLCYSSFTNDSSTPAVFHQLCDRHTNTLSVAHAEGTNYTFGGFVRCALLLVSISGLAVTAVAAVVVVCLQAVGSWNHNFCCSMVSNDCPAGTDYCIDSSWDSRLDFIFRLSPDAVERFEPKPGGHEYQLVAGSRWPQWGGDLAMGDDNAALGASGYCGCAPPNDCQTYGGTRNQICGGDQGTWGETHLEVWRLAGRCCSTCCGNSFCEQGGHFCGRNTTSSCNSLPGHGINGYDGPSRCPGMMDCGSFCNCGRNYDCCVTC
eukprot:COSAG06_NODE_2916_length_6098_cov_10.324721_4_plen_430_part_00